MREAYQVAVSLRLERSESLAAITPHRQFQSREQSWGMTGLCPCITARSDVSQDSCSEACFPWLEM
jgi:hypothetical protein